MRVMRQVSDFLLRVSIINAQDIHESLRLTSLQKCIGGGAATARHRPIINVTLQFKGLITQYSVLTAIAEVVSSCVHVRDRACLPYTDTYRKLTGLVNAIIKGVQYKQTITYAEM